MARCLRRTERKKDIFIKAAADQIGKLHTPGNIRLECNLGAFQMGQTGQTGQILNIMSIHINPLSICPYVVYTVEQSPMYACMFATD
ncbi:hypothetical protein VN97_g2804 [Penicillium thymicola]|uniref:Uncharacterized protein n=1 Tax=Penicillium thymicola TaxID=293382 RepID=A0AAI9XBW7_PENTH|nr:hypothetical protein VN97_g2804 [Penicillium thymicola]